MKNVMRFIMIYFIPVTPCNSKSFIIFYPSWGLTARHSTTSHENYPKKSSAPREDKLRYRYASNKIYEVWTGDVTELSTYSLLLYVDMTTRQIIGHLLRKKGLGTIVLNYSVVALLIVNFQQCFILILHPYFLPKKCSERFMKVKFFIA